MRIPALVAGTVQVWRGVATESYGSLSADEWERAGRMRAGPAREEFVAGRGLLRLLLAQALGRAPEELRFALGAQGKPSLVEGGEVDFNVAHARGVVLVALSRDGAVGVDLEPLDRAVEAMELARAHFHPREVAAIKAERDEGRRLALFFRCWTRKEAVAKADGRGLQLGLDQFCVLDDAVRTQDGGVFWVRDLELGTGFAGALAVPDREIMVNLLRADVLEEVTRAKKLMF